MYTNPPRSSYALWKKVVTLFKSYKVTRGMIFGGIMMCAMFAFELFNYTTTDFALSDLLGDMRFAGLRWAMILSIAFCGMDFAGIARLFTPNKPRDERLEVWYMLGAWFLAATMNATLTWWGVSIALLNHKSLGNAILSHQQLLAIVPVFVSVLVWLIRILMIGTFSIAGERLFTQAETTMRRYENEWARPAAPTIAPRPMTPTVSARPGVAPRPMAPAPTMAPRPAPAPMPAPAPKVVTRPAYTVGLDDEDDDEFDQRRRPEPYRAPVRTVPAAAMRPNTAPVTRPAPKPSANPTYTSSATTGYRSASPRTSETPGRDRH